MKNVVPFLMLVGLLFSFPFASQAQDVEKFLGEWTFNAPDAGYGYQTGTVTFNKAENGFTGEVKFADGYKVEMKDIVFEGNTVSYGITVEYEYIKVSLTLEKDTLSGKAGTSEGGLEVTAKR